MATHRHRAPLVLVPLLAAVALGVALLGSANAQRSGEAHAASATKGYTAKLSYRETNAGRPQGAATTGIRGTGKLSVKLGPHAALEAAVIALATGVPVTKIARGATYAVQRQIAGNGRVTGLAVATFKAHGLGTTCVSYSEKPGRFVPGSSFVPMTGSIKTVGGTGAARTWHVSVGFKQTSVAGSTTEQFGANGSEHASRGKPQGLSAACRRVAALLH